MRISRRSWSGWMGPCHGGADELPTRAQGRIFLVGAAPADLRGAARRVPWLGLPANPEWSPNRSHGITLNWIWHNVVRQLRPEIVGFVDHECFPIRPLDLPARFGDGDFRGRLLDAVWSGPLYGGRRLVAAA
jgi:hypothetical protein